MNLLRSATLGLATAAAIAGSLALSAGAAHATGPADYVVIHSSGSCDRATGQWLIDWSIQNLSADPATIVDVASTPTASPVVQLPGSLAGESTIHAAQRIAGSGGQMATLRINTTWASGSSYVSSWDFRPPSPCPATAATSTADSGPWPIVDANGVQRSSLSIDWSTGYATACYGGAAGDVRIEVRFESGETQQRIVPQFGCAVAGPYAGTGPVVAVRGLVGDFANGWHENA